MTPSRRNTTPMASLSTALTGISENISPRVLSPPLRSTKGVRVLYPY
jgi:hypothetical protein